MGRCFEWDSIYPPYLNVIWSYNNLYSKLVDFKNTSHILIFKWIQSALKLSHFSSSPSSHVSQIDLCIYFIPSLLLPKSSAYQLTLPLQLRLVFQVNQAGLDTTTSDLVGFLSEYVSKKIYIFKSLFSTLSLSLFINLIPSSSSSSSQSYKARNQPKKPLLMDWCWLFYWFFGSFVIFIFYFSWSFHLIKFNQWSCRFSE